MKPVYLEFCGINSFSETAKIDFRTLLSGGVFGIFGDTGSGKSTILDCIHFALYGVVDRVPKAINDCINYRCDSAYVVFDFEITTEGTRRVYRVRRERKRKTSYSKAFLYEYGVDGGLLALAEGVDEVNDALAKIIGLNFNDFKMCIALPQGDFAALVKSTTAERVKLVARLFDLEKYGERLFKKVNERYFAAENDVDLVKAKMGENDWGGEQAIAEKQAAIQADEQALQAVDAQLRQTEAEKERLTALDREKKAYDGLLQQMQTFLDTLPKMQGKRALAERLPQAKTVVEKARSLQEVHDKKAAAESAWKQAEDSRIRAANTLENKKKQLQESGFEDKILRLSVSLEKAQAAASDVAAAEEAKRALDECIKEFHALSAKQVKEDFDEKIANVDKQLLELGEDDSLLSYLKHHFKDLLLAETYGEIRLDLRELAKKYPQTENDVQTLIEKYTVVTVADERSFDIAKINLAFKQIEQDRKRLKTEREQIENRKRVYLQIESQKETLTQRGKILRKTHEEALEKIKLVKDLGTVSSLQQALEDTKKEQRAVQAELEWAQEQVQAFLAQAEKQQGLRVSYAETEEALLKELDACLQASGFATVDEAKALTAQIADEAAFKKAYEEFFEKYELCKHKIAETDVKKFDGYDENALAFAERKREEQKTNRDALTAKIASAKTEYNRLLALKEKYRELEKELSVKQKKKDLYDELRSLLRNNRFLEFIASEYLQEICFAASKTLLSLTGGRYFLSYDKEFKVGDNLDGGQLRAVKTLSGGETFLVSLALALSLSAEICRKSLRPIEFFFLDEGFGTLDGKLVDTVMDVLGKLSKSFAVGLISHVEELKHRIDSKILVTGASESCGSQVRMERY